MDITKNLKGDAKYQASTNISAAEFNVYFREVASKLIKSNLLDNNNNNNNANQSHKFYLNRPNIKSFVFMYTNPNEIITTVNIMPKKQSTMSSYLQSLIIDEIAQPLSLIFNKSIVQSIFPDQLKIAKVIPLH